jgi:hypothetical protein
MPREKPRETWSQAAEPPGPRGAAAAGDAGPEGLTTLLRRGLKAAIARWAVRSRGAAEIWPRPQDEAMHPWDGRRHFAEDYTLAAVQPGLAVVARIEWLPGREVHRVWLTLLTPGGVHALPGTGQALLRGAGDHWRAGGLAFDCVEPLRTWTVRYRGRLEARDARGRRRGPTGEDSPSEDAEVRLDLTFLSRVPAFVPGSDDDPDLLARQLGAAEWDSHLLRVLRRHTLRSYVQPGECHGSVALGARLLTFGGAGLRVHSWGVRDWGASDTALQCFATFTPHAGQGAYTGPCRAWVQQAQFPWVTLLGGFVQRAAGLVPIRDLGVTRDWLPGGAPSHVGLALEAPGGPLALELASLSELTLDMDGRGRVTMALCRVAGAGDGWALLLSQRRLLPRPAARP